MKREVIGFIGWIRAEGSSSCPFETEPNPASLSQFEDRLLYCSVCLTLVAFRMGHGSSAAGVSNITIQNVTGFIPF